MKKLTLWLLVICLLLGCTGCGSSDPTEKAAHEAAEYILKTAEPVPGSEWAALTFSVWGDADTSAWTEEYLSAMKEYVSENNGLPGALKVTDYARTVLALTAAGENAAAFAGVDLTIPLRDEDLVRSQGVTAVSFALLALDSGEYAEDINYNYVNILLSLRLPDGGWAVSGERSDPDTTAMSLQALAPYREQEEVHFAAEEAVACLSSMQGQDGCWTSWGVTNSESCAQVILALCALGISADDDRFVKSGVGLAEDLLRYAQKDGGFAHTPDGGSNLMASMQALQALTALQKGNIFRTAGNTCTVEVRCDSLLSRMDDLREEKRSLIPADGVILPRVHASFSEGESAMDVTLRVLSEHEIHYEFSKTPGTDSEYMEGIGNLYEFDAGALSGWEYMLNGKFCGTGASRQPLSPGDRICWVYTCDFGLDVGNNPGK